MKTRIIPDRWGTIDFGYVNALVNDKPTPAQNNNTLPPGRWAVSSQTRVPYVAVTIGGDTRWLTWAESIEIGEGEIGHVANASYHPGRIVFDGIGTGLGYQGQKPPSLIVPIIYQQVDNLQYPYPIGALSLFSGRLSNTLDTRRARTVWLVQEPLALGEGSNLYGTQSLDFVEYLVQMYPGTVQKPFGSNTSSNPVPPGTIRDGAKIILSRQVSVDYGRVQLGLGAGIDEPNSITRGGSKGTSPPSGVWDYLTISDGIDEGDPEYNSIFQLNPHFMLEYDT